ncbi:MAG: hydrogenase expression/formation protein HypE [Candidatus Nitrospinota bacterium M3_3B_026]
MPSGRDGVILLGHGSGGAMTGELLEKIVLPCLYEDGKIPEQEDAALIDAPPGKFLFTTDSYVVDPFIFPGGNIGELAVNGTINDIAMRGGRPIAISAGFILEEGLSIEKLETVLRSMGRAARAAGVQITCGDTKVVPKGRGDGIYVNTSGVGAARDGQDIRAASARPGGRVLVNGTIGDHGVAVMSAREGFEFSSPVRSDTAQLAGLVADILDAGVEVSVLRDATRGGLATVLVEIAEAAGVNIRIDERAIPLSPGVNGACELLGLDPVYIANEGKMALVVPEHDAERALQVMRSHPLGERAAIIGEVEEGSSGKVFMTSLVGGSRLIGKLPGELLPRIC